MSETQSERDVDDRLGGGGPKHWRVETDRGTSVRHSGQQARTHGSPGNQELGRAGRPLGLGLSVHLLV